MTAIQSVVFEENNIEEGCKVKLFSDIEITNPDKSLEYMKWDIPAAVQVLKTTYF